MFFCPQAEESVEKQKSAFCQRGSILPGLAEIKCWKKSDFLLEAALENFESKIFHLIIFCELNVVGIVCWTNSCQKIN